MQRAVVACVVLLSACGQKTVGDTEVKAALDGLADQTIISCVLETNKYYGVVVRGFSINGRSCADQNCEVDTTVELSFTPHARKIGDTNHCGFDIGKNWNYPGFTAWLTKGPGNIYNSEWERSGRYASDQPLQIRANLFFKKFDSGWRFEGVK